MRVRNSDEPTTYVDARGKGKKPDRRTKTIYGATPDDVMKLLEWAIREKESRKAIGRAQAAIA